MYLEKPSPFAGVTHLTEQVLRLNLGISRLLVPQGFWSLCRRQYFVYTDDCLVDFVRRE